MICKTIEQMQRVANAGAIKMHRQGYTYQQNDVLSNNLQTSFSVILPEAFQSEGNPAAHIVSISNDENPICFCTCQFYQNHQFGFDTTCKHIEYILAEENDRAQTEAQELAEAEHEDWVNMATGDERAHQWNQHNTPCHLPDHSIYNHYLNA